MACADVTKDQVARRDWYICRGSPDRLGETPLSETKSAAGTLGDGRFRASFVATHRLGVGQGRVSNLLMRDGVTTTPAVVTCKVAKVAIGGAGRVLVCRASRAPAVGADDARSAVLTGRILLKTGNQGRYQLRRGGLCRLINRIQRSTGLTGCSRQTCRLRVSTR